MTTRIAITLTGAALVGLAFAPASVLADGRHYYSEWVHVPQKTYYVTQYYYKPVTTEVSYHSHYCYYYPAQPRYVYYYNPYSRQYWGRFDLEAKGENAYSILKKEDRKEVLTDIPEGAFPEPGKMPAIPESKDGASMAKPPAPPKDNQ